MQRMLFLMLAILAMAIPFTSMSTTTATTTVQVQNEGLANAILAVRKQDAAMMQQYNWNSRVEILENGTVQDIRIELVTVGPNGSRQRSLLNDTPGALPNGFFRKIGAENQRKELMQSLEGLRGVIEQYALPSAGKVIDFIATAQVQPITSPDGKTLLQVTGNNVVVPGDTFSLTLDATTYKTRRLQVSTTYNGNPASFMATFMTLPSGLTMPQYATIEMPSKNATVMVHNFDFVAND